MIDKELIAMCDCPEIQDRWEPKVGDVCDSADELLDQFAAFKGRFANEPWDKGLLRFYMHLEHNKTWNGEAWV